MHRSLLALTVAAATASAAAVHAQPPRIANGRVTTTSGVPLRQAFAAALTARPEPGWIGYAVPAIDGERTMCCNGDACCAACTLEGGGNVTTRGTQPPAGAGPVKLEGPDQLLVLFRAAKGIVERIRIFSETCQLDAGGRDVVWLTGVQPAESVALLESLTSSRQEGRDRMTDGAVAAIAMHRDASADAALERLVQAAQPVQVRARVPFWLGNARGASGLALLQRLLRDDPAAEVKKKAVFGISQSRETGAVDILIANARSHAEASVRGEALFWLAQKAGSKAASAISERVEQDPDTEVKKRAVFALSQLPRNEGVPLLVNVARTHSNPAVRKQAMFWLGQSKDPRALEFFAEILK
jgi:hypothetical protein